MTTAIFKLRRGVALLLILATATLPGVTDESSSERTFTTPILLGFHADPSICRGGDDYFMVHSTFEYFPGVPVYQSRDLVNWKLIGHCLTRKSQLKLDKVRR
jgi:alpha-N-arabinofuranosidase